MNIFSQRSERGTFRPKRSTPGPRGARLKSHIDATLGSGNLRDAVMLPPGEELNEWLAANTVDFYNAVNVLYGALAGAFDMRLVFPSWF
jgi:MOB kinase activator 1